MIALCASLLFLYTVSLLQATDNLDNPKNNIQTEQSQDAQNSSESDSLELELDDKQVHQFAMIMLGLQAFADRHGVDFETQDFIDTVKWKVFAKHYGIKITAPEFCAHLMQAKNSDAQWALFCQKHTNIDKTITPTELCGQLLETIKLKNERHSKLKYKGIPFFTLLGATGGTVGTSMLIAHNVDEITKATIYDQLKSAAKNVASIVGFSTLEYMPNVIEKGLDAYAFLKKTSILKKYKLNTIGREIDDLFVLRAEQLRYIIASKPLNELKKIAASCNLDCSGMPVDELQDRIGSHLIKDIQAIKGKTWSIKGVPIITRDQLLLNVLGKSVSEGVVYQCEDTGEFTKSFVSDLAQKIASEKNPELSKQHNVKITSNATESIIGITGTELTQNVPKDLFKAEGVVPHLMKLKSPETAIKINKHSPNTLQNQGVDGAIIFSANLLDTVIDNVGNHAIEKIADKPIIAFKDGTFIILSRKDLAQITKQSTQEFVTHALYSQLSANRSKLNDDCSKLKLHPKDFFILFGVNTVNEATYNIVSHLGNPYLPEYLPRNGKPQNIQQTLVKKGVNLAVERILLHPKKYAELAPMAIRYAPDAIRWQLLANNSPDKEWGITYGNNKKIKITSRNQCIDVITQTLSDIANHNVRIVAPDKNNKFDHFTSLIKHHHSTEVGDRDLPSLKDCGLFVSRRLIGKAIDNLAKNVIKFTPSLQEDKPIVQWRNTDLPVITRQQAMHVVKKSAKDCVAHALLSKLKSNQGKDNEDATKKKTLTATDVASIVSLHTANEVLYNVIARCGNIFLPEYFPENGTPETAIHAEVKDTVQKVTPFVLIPALKLVGKGIEKFGDHVILPALVATIPNYLPIPS